MSQQINLFNPVFLKQKKIFTTVPMAEALAVILVGTLAMTYYGSRRVAVLEKEAAGVKAQLAQRETRLSSVSAMYAPRQRSKTLESELDLSEARLAALRDVSDMLQGGALGNRKGYAEYFRALARQSVGGLWLTGVTINGAGLDIGVQGRAMQATLIPNFIGRLSTENIMRGKTFGSLEVARPAAEPADGAAVSAPAAASAGAANAVAATAPFVEFNLQSSMAGDAKTADGKPDPMAIARAVSP